MSSACVLVVCVLLSVSLPAAGQQNLLAFGAVPNDGGLEAALANTAALQAAVAAATQAGEEAAARHSEDFWQDVHAYSQSVRSSSGFAAALARARQRSPLFYSPAQTVIIPAADFTIFYTPLTVCNNVLIQFDGTLQVFQNQTYWHDFGPQTPGDFGVLQLEGCTGVTFQGKPKQFAPGHGQVPVSAPDIDGDGWDWWVAVVLGAWDQRPHLVFTSQSSQLVFSGMYVRNSPQYHFCLHDGADVYFTNTTIYVDVESQSALMRRWDGYDAFMEEAAYWLPHADALTLPFNLSLPMFPLNTDGIDPSAVNVLIEDFYIENFDDAVAVKPAGTDGVLCQCASNMLIRNGAVKFSLGLTIGSVPPSTTGNCVRNITFDTVDMHLPIKALYIKTNPGDHGYGIIDTISYANIQADWSLWYPVWVGPQQQAQPKNGSNTGCSFFYPLNQTCATQPLVSVSNISLTNVSFTNSLLIPGVFLCDPEQTCQNVTLDGVSNDGIFLVQKSYDCHNAFGSQTDASPLLTCLQPGPGDESWASAEEDEEEDLALFPSATYRPVATE